MQLFDSHCHLTADRFDEERNDVLKRAREGGVVRLVTIASDLEDARRAVSYASSNDGVWSTAGVHPHEVGEAGAGDLAQVRELAQNNAGIVAIGETGLDFFYDNSPRALQVEWFDEHLRLGADLGLPVVVHSRHADGETIAALRRAPAGVVGVLHCFTGGSELLKVGLEAGWYVSLSGIVTFKKFDDAGMVREIPRDRLLIETDSPYLAPVPERGKRNEPAFVRHVCDAVAAHRGEAPGEVAAYTFENATRFYGLGA